MLGLPVPGFLLTLVLGHERGQKEQRAGPWPLTRFPAMGEGTAAVTPLPRVAFRRSPLIGHVRTRSNQTDLLLMLGGAEGLVQGHG